MDVPVTPWNEPFNVSPEKSKHISNPAGLSRHAGVIVGDDVRKLFEYARAKKFAIPAINVTSSSTANAALEAAQDSKAPIILQISSGGSEFVGGKGLARGEGRTIASKHDVMIRGSIALAHYIRSIAPFYGIPVVLHTDHCHPSDTAWLDGLLAADIEHNSAYQGRLRGLKEARASKESLAKLENDLADFVKNDPPARQRDVEKAEHALKTAGDSFKEAQKNFSEEADEFKAAKSAVAGAEKTLKSAIKARDEEHPARVAAYKHQIALWPKALEAINREIEAGLKEPLFSSHMIDFSPRSREENIAATKKRLETSVEAGTWLEMEIGITGGEEDGHDNSKADKKKLYTNPEEIWEVFRGLKDTSGNFSIAAAFGNVHGVYEADAVKLRPWLLGKHQKYVKAKLQDPNGDIPGAIVPNQPDDMDPEDVNTDEDPKVSHPVFLVFHGGSGSDPKEFKEGIKHGVVKVNIDTDTQWAYLQPVRDYVKANLNRLETQVGIQGSDDPDDKKKSNKKFYDPREWIRHAEKGMKARVQLALDEFNATGQWDWKPTE
ncbi:Fructose-bisphosphate aldolase 1 [Diatrype stigma]|uniref:Fructose-bisphosphate aldolase n=1 Tax=Diatrype stigma TaxID=117547 RepID=A0AAN9YV61_9PEZI